jgi:HupE / UreJ protein
MKLATALKSLALAAALMWGTPALAHKGSDAYLDVQEANAGTEQTIRRYQLTLSVAIKDIDLVLALDANADGKVTWGEIRAATPGIVQLLNQTAHIDSPDRRAAGCQVNWLFEGIERRSDGAYLRLGSQTECPATEALELRYTLFSVQDANHRLLVAGQVGGKDLLTVASPQQTVPVALSLPQPRAAHGNAGQPAPATRWNTLLEYLQLGMHHLLEGYDHMAFLLALVLPLQLRLARQPATSAAAVAPLPNRPRTGVWLVLLRTVTAFTVGHSITLMLATFGWTQASPLWVEPLIAISIGVTAWLNLHPVKRLRADVLALVFGLVHGFGFAGLLQEAAAPAGLLPYALAGFNIGVEAGQLMAVSAWVLLSQLFVAQPWYQTQVVRRGSQMLMLLASFWFLQRVV